MLKHLTDQRSRDAHSEMPTYNSICMRAMIVHDNRPCCGWSFDMGIFSCSIHMSMDMDIQAAVKRVIKDHHKSTAHKTDSLTYKPVSTIEPVVSDRDLCSQAKLSIIQPIV